MIQPQQPLRALREESRLRQQTLIPRLGCHCCLHLVSLLLAECHDDLELGNAARDFTFNLPATPDPLTFFSVFFKSLRGNRHVLDHFAILGEAFCKPKCRAMLYQSGR